MNPADLKSLVDQHASTPGVPGMPPPTMSDDEDMAADADAEDSAEQATGAARGQQLIEQWGEFGKTLKEEAGELHDLSHDVGAELLLKEVPDDALKAVGKAVDGMPDELSMGLAKYVSKLSPEDCEALGAALVQEIGEDKADANLLYAFLHEAAKYAGEEIDVDDDFNESEEEDDEEESDDNEEEDAGDTAVPADENGEGGNPY